ncbi:MAG: 5'/3'-nucleotidase SurE, partial [Candidatus Eisenbacteria bacterium]|nr:5'/3'-nucleotidase SurE [Candidatus Eisenbacteria bacterium]
MKPLIVLANDDGITAPNLLALRDELRASAEVIV